MTHAVPLRLTRLRALALTASLVVTVGCRPPATIRGASSSPDAAIRSSAATAGAVVEDDAPLVVVREYPHSPTASIVGWLPGESWLGLRSTMRLDGSLVWDHQLYVSTYAVTDWTSFTRADWHAFSQSMHKARVLRFTGVSRDVHSCDGGSSCTPYEIFSARIPDDFLRKSLDSVVVVVRARNGNEAQLTLRRELIVSYLAVVDSVVAVRRSATRPLLR